LRYLIAAPEGELADWQVGCVRHLTNVGARAVGRIATGRTQQGVRSLFWSIATTLARPRSVRPPRAGSALHDLPLLKSVDDLGENAIDFVLDFGESDGDSVDASFFSAAQLGFWRFAFAP